MDTIVKKRYRERYDAMRKTDFEEYVKIIRRRNIAYFVLVVILGLSLYFVLLLSIVNYAWIKDEKMDKTAFINVAENLCEELEQKYAKTELLKGGNKVVIYCEKENIIFEPIK